jgi:iron(III) transport system ATP-binding protein
LKPATEYVAAFIGKSNRLPVRYADGGWKAGAAAVGGARLRPSDGASDVVVRVSPDDARLARSVEDLAPHEAGIAAVVADVEFGGRHLDVTVETGDGQRLHVRADLRRSEDFLKVLSRGDDVVFALDTDAAHYYPAPDGVRLPPEPASVGVVA